MATQTNQTFLEAKMGTVIAVRVYTWEYAPGSCNCFGGSVLGSLNWESRIIGAYN